jgi:hypothetical protein
MAAAICSHDSTAALYEQGAKRVIDRSVAGAGSLHSASASLLVYADGRCCPRPEGQAVIIAECEIFLLKLRAARVAVIQRHSVIGSGPLKRMHIAAMT